MRALVALLLLLGTVTAGAQEYLAIERAEEVLKKSTDPRARRAAVQELAKLASPKAIPVLVAALRPAGRDPREDWFVRRTAQSALAALGEPAVEALVPLVRDPEAVVRQACVEVLVVLEAEGLDELLSRRLLEEPDATVRSAGIAALATIGGDVARAAIARAAKEDADTRVRERAAALLQVLRDPPEH